MSVSNQAPRKILVTGATDGIGKATAEGLLRAGCHVIVHGRNKPRVDAAVAELQSLVEGSAAKLEGISFDLGSLAAIRSGAAAIASAHSHLDVLIHNAGIFAEERIVNADGMEMTFAVNCAAPFLLTHLLLPTMLASSAPMVIHVSSIAHSRGTVFVDDLTLGRNFTGYQAYAQSKLVNVMQSIDLAAQQPRIKAYSLHPGVIGTKLLRQGFGGVRGASVGSGATTSVALALGTLDGPSGSYFSDGVATPCGVAARDAAVRATLDAVTLKLVGL